MFLWLWIELTCILAPIFQYHFSLLESGYGSDVTWLNSNPIWLFFCCSSLGNQETSCTKLHMRWNHVQDPRDKPRVSFSCKTLLGPSWLYYIGLGRAGPSARLWCNYIVNSHFVSYCELYAGRSLYLPHFRRWHYTGSTSLSQSGSVIEADTEGWRGWRRRRLCLKGIPLATFTAVLSISVPPCLADITFAFVFYPSVIENTPPILSLQLAVRWY